MANAPVNRVKVGQVELAQWAGTYNDQPTTSFSLKKTKFNKDEKKWEESKFLNVTDLMSIINACQIMVQDYYRTKNTSPDDF